MAETHRALLGFAWYRREQWGLFRTLATDGDELENTYDEWMVGAQNALKTLESEGMTVRKVDVDINELVSWCKEHDRPLDSAARSAYAGERVQD